MVFLDAVLAATAVGVLLGGSPAALGELRLRTLWLAYSAIALQVVAFPSNVLPWATPDGLARGAWLLSYSLLIGMIAQNRHVRGLLIVGAGLACNLVAIVANGGLMPVTRDALRATGHSYDVRNNSISLAEPRLSGLVDRFAAPGWLPFGNVFSVGDVLIGAGIILVIVLAMRPRLLRRIAPALEAGWASTAAGPRPGEVGFAGVTGPEDAISAELHEWADNLRSHRSPSRAPRSQAAAASYTRSSRGVSLRLGL